MKKLIACVLSLMMVMLYAVSMAETPLEMLSEMISDMTASKTGFDMAVEMADSKTGHIGYIPDNGKLKHFYADFPFGKILADDKAAYAVTDNEVAGVAYETIRQMISGKTQEKTTPNALDSVIGTILTDFLSMIPQDAYSVEQSSDGAMTIRIQIKTLFAALDDAVPALLEKHGTELEAALATMKGKAPFLPTSAEQMLEAWQSLHLKDTDPGFDVLQIALAPSMDEEGFGYKAEVTADGTMLCQGKFVMGFDGSLSASLEGFGHTLRADAIIDGTAVAVQIQADGSPAMDMAFATEEGAFRAYLKEYSSNMEINIDVGASLEATLSTGDGSVMFLSASDVTAEYSHDSTARIRAGIRFDESEYPLMFMLVGMDKKDDGYVIGFDTEDDGKEATSALVNVTWTPTAREIPEVTHWMTADEITALLNQANMPMAVE